MNVSVGGLVMVLAFQAYSLWLVTRVPKLWRGDVPPRWRTALGATGYEGGRNRLAFSAFPVVAVGTAIFAPTLIALVFVNPKGAGAYVVIGLILVEGAVILGLLTAIGLFHRPSCLIPPMMRDRT